MANDKLPEFEVADIQLTKDTVGQPRAQFLPGGRVQFQALPMKFMVLAALVKGKGDLKIKPSAKEGALDCNRSNEDGVIMVTCRNMTMEELANGVRGMAPAYIDKPVVNLTELKGAYDFKFGWTPRGQLLGTAGGRGGAADGAARPDGGVLNASEPTAGGMTVFESMGKQLGLRLESTRHAIPIVVVDKVNRTATEN